MISMKRSSLVYAINSPVRLKVTVLTGHLKRKTLEKYKYLYLLLSLLKLKTGYLKSYSEKGNQISIEYNMSVPS
jgi:hypothetical protein